MMTRTLLAGLSLLLLAADPAAAPEWKVFDAKEGGFSLKFPGEPTANDQTVDTEAGKITAKMFVLEADNGNVAYMAGYNDYPAGALHKDPNVVLDGARDGAVSNVSGTLKSEKKITVNGHPGRELVIRAPIPGTTSYMLTHARVFLVNQRLVQALVVMPEENVRTKDVRTYLDSLKIASKKTK